MSNATGIQDKLRFGIQNGTEIINFGNQPKLGYRFIVKLEGFSASEIDANSRTLTGHVVSVTPPDFVQDEVPVDVYTSKYFVAGKHGFGDITLELRNDLDGEVVEIVQRQLDKQYDAKTQSHARQAKDFKFTVKILYLDGSNGLNTHPNIKEAFVCTGCWLKSVNWGQLQYSSNDPVSLTLTIRPDNVYHIVSRGSMNVALDGEPSRIDPENVTHRNSTVYNKGGNR